MQKKAVEISKETEKLQHISKNIKNRRSEKVHLHV